MLLARLFMALSDLRLERRRLGEERPSPASHPALVESVLIEMKARAFAGTMPADVVPTELLLCRRNLQSGAPAQLEELLNRCDALLILRGPKNY